MHPKGAMMSRRFRLIRFVKFENFVTLVLDILLLGRNPHIYPMIIGPHIIKGGFTINLYRL
jgi:hypothetical protein